MAAKLIHKNLIGAYVYAIVVDGTVRYIGKGRRYRVLEHVGHAKDINRRRALGEKVKALPFHNRLAKAIRNGASIEYFVIANELTDAAAYERERSEIAQYPLGHLWNLHSGGSGGDAEMMRRYWSDPKYREKFLAAIAAGHRNPDYRERARKKAQAQWDDPEFYAQQMAREKALWENPEYRAKRIAILQRVWSDPHKSARKSALVKSQWTQERSAKQSASRKAAWADPEFSKRVRAKIAASKAKPEYIEKMSRFASDRWADPEFRKKTVAAIRASKAKRNDRSKERGSICAAGLEKIQASVVREDRG
jgi:flagellar biosynthesis GTPase FlhF